MNNKKTGLMLICFFIILGVCFLAYYYKVALVHQKSNLPVIGQEQNHHIGNFSFTNQAGKTITEKDMNGKIAVVSYFFATCRSICPKMNENMTKVYKAFRGDTNVIIMCHTVDPKKDTVEALKAYGSRFDADPKQWMFLTGDKKQLYDMARYSYLINAEDTANGVTIEDDFIHDQHYVLVDRFGRIRGFYDGLDNEKVTTLIRDINDLLKE